MKAEGKWLAGVAVQVFDCGCYGQPKKLNEKGCPGRYRTHHMVDKENNLYSLNKDYFATGRELCLQTELSSFKGLVVHWYGFKTIPMSLWAGGPSDNRVVLVIEVEGAFDGPAQTLQLLGQGRGAPSFFLIPKEGYEEIEIETSVSTNKISFGEYLVCRKNAGLEEIDFSSSYTSDFVLGMEYVVPYPRQRKSHIDCDEIVKFTQGIGYPIP